MSGNFAPGRLQAATSAGPEFAGPFARIESVPGRKLQPFEFRRLNWIFDCEDFRHAEGHFRVVLSGLDRHRRNQAEREVAERHLGASDRVSGDLRGRGEADGAVPPFPEARILPAAAWTLCVRVQHFWTVRCPICLRPKTVCRIWAGCFPAVRILHKTTSGDSFALIDTGCHSPKAT